MSDFRDIYEQDRRHTFSITLRHVHVTIVVVEKKEVLLIQNVCLQS